MRSSQQELQAKEVLFLEDKNRLLEELKSVRQSLAPTVTADRSSNESSPKTAQEPKGFKTLTASLLKGLNSLNLLDDKRHGLAVLLRLSSNVASKDFHTRLQRFLREGLLNQWYCLEHVEDKGEKFECPASKERCIQQGHGDRYCFTVRVIEKRSVRQLSVRCPRYD